MLGKWIVSFMNVALNLAALAIIIGCAIIGYNVGGGFIGLELVGLAVGVGVGFLLDVIFLGALFFIMEINNNLIRIEARLATISTPNQAVAKHVDLDAKDIKQQAEPADKGVYPKEEIIDGKSVTMFLCPHCSGPISIPSAHAGRAGKCPHCGVFIDYPVLSKGVGNVA
jgi:hypothetical protein